MSYLQTIKADAIKVWHSHRILPSICGAQASLESGSGTSKLSKPPYNNHFGIKAGTDWTGRTVSMLTGEHVNGGRIEIYADFRAYDSIYDSIADYAAFFTSTPWRKENYKHVVGETDYKKAANALRAAGYATDPQYPTKLIRIIENNNLQSWDREALASSAGSAPSTQTTATKYDSSKSSNATAINTSGWNQAEVDQFLMNAVDPPYINGAYINRFLTAYYPDSPLIGEGDTIKTMADYYGISVGAAMGVWAKETTFGREHPGLVDHNYGCIKWTSGSVYPSVTYDGTQWNKYPSKKVGIAAWFHLLRYNYIELGYHRYDSFLNRYSPTGDGNVHATFKNIMWGALKSFGYDTSETSTKYNHSKPSDNPSTVKPPASIGSGGTVVDATSKPINKRVGGQFTDAVAAYVKTNGATWIGDSLLVGTEPFAKKYSPVSNFDGLGSRQISHATPSLNATQVIRNMLNAGTLKDIIIFIIGTNRGVTKAEVDTVMSIIGSNRKIIFVSTASEVNHSAGVQGEYYGASENYSNAFFANWNQEARAKRAVYYTPDGAGGKYIHMTPTGYEAHAKYLLAAFYEVANADHSQDVAVEQKPEFLSIEDYELTEDGIITYYENTKQVTGSDGKVTLMPEKKTYDTGIKGFYSPKGDKFVYNPDANNRWGHAVDAGNPSWIDTIYTNESTNSAVEMIEGAIQELINRSEPASQYTVSLLDVDETLSIGDTGVFIDHNFNPPLYIEARVLSISTSMTDIASNTIVIGNVVELVQKENPAITALKAELQATREEVKQEMQNSNPIVANIVSSNGPVLGDAHKETQLSVILLQGTKDVTDQFSRFEWERVSSDAASDKAFNRLLEVEKSNTIKVFNRDIKNNQSIFIARAYNESGDAFFQAETKLNYSDTALWTNEESMPADAVDGSVWIGPSGEQKIKVNDAWEDRVTEEKATEIVKRDGTTVSFGDNLPTGGGKPGDVWFRVNEDGSQSIMRHNGTEFVETITDSLSADGIKKGVMDFSEVAAININASSITAGHADFLSVALHAINSKLTMDGASLRILNQDGSFIELNNVPEMRSTAPNGTSIVMGNGRSHYYDSNGNSKGYIGTDMHGGTRDFGTFLSKGSGIYRFARMADVESTEAKYYTVVPGDYRVSIIEKLVRRGELPDGNAQDFINKSNMIARLNGWPILPQEWPTLRAGQQIKYSESKVIGGTSGNRYYVVQAGQGWDAIAQAAGVPLQQILDLNNLTIDSIVHPGDTLLVEVGTGEPSEEAYEDIWKFGPSSTGDWRVYFLKHARFEGGFTDVSDRRIKHDILPTAIEALPEIEKFDFKEYKMDSDGRHVDLGLIAQEAGILRVADDELEGIDIQKGIMLALKGVQELNQVVKEQTAEIDRLKNRVLELEGGN